LISTHSEENKYPIKIHSHQLQPWHWSQN
jgi:hypothetical protein